MTSGAKKKLAAVGAMLVAVGLLSYLAMGGIGENLVYFLSVDELIAKGEEAKGPIIRLAGLVRPGTFVWDKESLDLSFEVTADESAEGASVKVRASGAPPQMFREGIGVVVEGTFDGNHFNADRVIVKHSNEYQPPTEGEMPQEVYKILMEDQS